MGNIEYDTETGDPFSQKKDAMPQVLDRILRCHLDPGLRTSDLKSIQLKNVFLIHKVEGNNFS